MMKTKNIFILLIFFLSVCTISAQQLPHFRNYSFNLAALNPATVSMKEVPDIMIDHRSQWIGFDGAPRISSITGKYMFNNEMGVSALIMSDRLGLTQRLDFNLDYGYVIRTDAFNLGFGLAWTLTQFKLLSSEMTIYNADDQIINLSSNDKTWKPDANIGVILSSSDYFAGISMLQLFRTKYSFFGSTNDVPGLIRDSRHIFITGGYHFKNDDSQHIFTPTLNMYMAKGTPFKFDLIANYSYKNIFQTSLNFSKGDALVFSAGYRYDRFVFSYSFDIIMSRIKTVSSGAHEICVGIYLGKSEKSEKNSSPMF